MLLRGCVVDIGKTFLILFNVKQRHKEGKETNTWEVVIKEVAVSRRALEWGQETQVPSRLSH